ncbi:prodigiosin biosynthesis protein PigM [Serratia sp. PAMC26656]|uniref:prodigiosin biosynthesis protein PigM n=1 Tax=Serratia sp. PAMC26656 TaxID=2775909 RepID=UPI001F2F3118|nr:prodigiosin biosynthesis protein PigM [Serratia sp. PAMC26656]
MRNDAFEQALQNGVDIARLAPSSHNCQPWSVRYHADTQQGWVTIDRPRALKGLPSLEREMLMSCGLFFEYVSTLLKHAGYPLDWRWEGTHRDDPVGGLISFTPAMPITADINAYSQLAKAITERRTVRAPYQPTQVNPIQQACLHTLFDGSPVTLHFYQGEPVRHAVAHLTTRYASLDFSHHQAWQETYQFIRFNERQYTEDGFYLHNLFGPVSNLFKCVFRIAFHPKLTPLATRLQLPAMMAKGLAKQVGEGPQYLAMSLQDESDEHLFIAGMTLGQLWLTLHSWGWGLHPISVLVQHASARHALSDTLALVNPAVFFARFGHLQQSGAATPRRSWQSILTVSHQHSAAETKADVSKF